MHLFNLFGLLRLAGSAGTGQRFEAKATVTQADGELGGDTRDSLLSASAPPPASDRKLRLSAALSAPASTAGHWAHSALPVS